MPETTPELIAAVGDRLTPTDRRIAEAVLSEPTLLAFGTVSDLADHVGTSRPSIMRFANKLGFGGYSDLQSHVRRGLSQRLSRPSDRIRDHGGVGSNVQVALEGAIGGVVEAAGGERLGVLAEPLVSAQDIWIVSGETSQAGAHALASGLTMVRPGVHFVEEHSMGRDLGSAGSEDAAVVFDFFRYRRHSVRTARTLARLGVSIVAITDGPLSPLASLTDRWCALTVPAIGPFDSSVPAVAMAELLVAEVARQLHDEATERIDRTEDLWAATGTYLV